MKRTLLALVIMCGSAVAFGLCDPDIVRVSDSNSGYINTINHHLYGPIITDPVSDDGNFLGSYYHITYEAVAHYGYEFSHWSGYIFDGIIVGNRITFEGYSNFMCPQVETELIAIFTNSNSGGSSPNPPNDDNYEEISNHYYLVQHPDIHWTNCQVYAESLGGYLASITSSNENSYINNLLDELIGTVDSEVFLGGIDENEDGSWAWTSGETWYWHSFLYGEGSANYEKYLKITHNQQTQWEWRWVDFNGEGADADHYMLIESDQLISNLSTNEVNEYLSTNNLVYLLDISTNGNGSINIPNDSYPAGTNLNLSITPNDGWLFTGWSGDISGDYTESNKVITLNEDMNIIANFSDDADNDSITNNEEYRIGSNPRYSETMLDMYAIASNRFSLAEAQETMRDLRIGSQTLGVSNGNATIRMFVDESSDLTSTWSNTQHVLELDIPADADTKFYRFRMD